MPGRIRIFVAEGQRLFREALISVLRTREDLCVVGEAESGHEALHRILDLAPDVAILDERLPGADGAAVARRLVEASAPTAVVVLLDGSGPERLAVVRDAGARGCLAKDRTRDDLVAAVRCVAGGDYYPAELADPGVASRGSSGGRMTPREREIAVLLADGYSTKEAAAVLGISARTAETHRAAVIRKLGARNVTDVVKYCIRNRLIDL